MYHAAPDVDEDELFLYFNPQLQYMNYDATILGSRFNDDSPVTFPLIELRFNAEVGIKYRHKNWNYSYSVNYRGKELSNNVITGYYYGSIMIGYFL
jgi:lipid A 3-O-deacylase